MTRSLPLVTLFILLAAAAALTGCASTSAPYPSVHIISPKDGAVIPSGNVSGSVSVSDFLLVNRTYQPNEQFKGHLLYYMDVQVPITQAGVPRPGQIAIVEPGTSNATINTTHVWKNVTPGKHTFSVQLVNNDNTPLNPAVTDTVEVLVTGYISPPTPTVPTPTPSPLPYMVTPTPVPTLAPGVRHVTVGLTAHNIQYNRSTITVPACSHVTIVFHNEDNGIPHNFALFNTSAAQHNLFTGKIITGPQTTDYNFTAPCTPGHYFYHCDVHPTIMTGTFIVTPANQTGNMTMNQTKNVTTPQTQNTTTTRTQNMTMNQTQNMTTNQTSKVTTNQTSVAGPKVTIGLTAHNIKFNRSTITVPPCANVTVIFDNKDNGIPHDFAVYNTSAAQHAIFVGQIITGPKTTDYHFKAPCTPGTYYFRCNVHPTIMNGQFIVNKT